QGSNTTTVSLSSVDATETSVTAAKTAVNEANPNFGETFVLTTGSNDVVNGTALNDLFDGSTEDTLQTGDIVLDSTSTDADILNALVTTNDVKARIQNIETLNVDGKYVDTGLDLTDVTGSKVLNVDTNYGNGTAEITAASTLAVETIKAGSNIKTLNVEAAGFGTRDTLVVDANKAEEVTLDTGGAAAINSFDVTTTGNVTIKSVGANSEVKLNLSDAKTTITGNGALGSLTINQTGVDGEITIGGLLTAGAEATGEVKTTINSDQDVTVKAENAKITNTAMDSTGTGTLTVQLTDDADGIKLADVEADVIDIATASAASDTAVGVTVNASSKVKISADIVDTAPGVVTITQANAKDAAAVLGNGKGTLNLEVAKSQTGVVTADVTTKTVLLNAGVDAAAAAGAVITMADLQLGAEANTLLIDGSEALKLSKLTLDVTTKDFVSAEDMTGNLTISDVVGTGEATIILGKGDDSLTITTGTGIYTIEGTAGKNTIDIANAGAGSKVTGGTGDDTIIGNTAGSTLNGGAGDDLITTGGTKATTVDAGAGDDTVIIGGATAAADMITLGAGSDKVVVDSGQTGATVKDFVAGTDTLILTGEGVDIDLTKLADPTTGTYNFDGSDNFKTTLQNAGTAFTAKDLSDSIQLGYVNADGATKAYTVTQAKDSSATINVVAGDKDDIIKVAMLADTNSNADNSTTNLTLGAGADTVILNATVNATDTNTVTVTDFVIGTDKIVLEGTATAALDLTATTVSSGVIDLDVFDVTLKNGTAAVFADSATDVSTAVQLGSSGKSFLAAAGAVTGGVFDDFIDVITGNAIVNFIDNGGMDTITNFNAGDKLSFGALTGIVADQSGKLITKATAATSGDVYVLNDNTSINGDTIDFSKLGETVDGAKVTLATDSVVADIVAYLNNALTDVKANHTYAAVINDNSDADIESYAYLINATSDTITADDITLIGTIDGNVALVAGDIA
ncbi:MAG: hypothetical protein M0Q87_15085, partial [Ottowia sp.]|nr:hypothetical protein [Ottowia sp.]